MADRQCPNCERMFRIHFETYQSEHYLNLRCPYCEWVAEFDDFTTEKQIEYVKAVRDYEGARMMEEVLGDALGDFLEIEEVFSPNQSVPSPRVSTDLEVHNCSVCSFEYELVKERGGVCPVCRS